MEVDPGPGIVIDDAADLSAAVAEPMSKKPKKKKKKKNKKGKKNANATQE